MTRPVNLRAARKQRERLKKRAEADENAEKFGSTKAERALTEARARKLRDHLDAHRRED